MVEQVKALNVVTDQQTEQLIENSADLGKAKLPTFRAPRDFFINATYCPALTELKEQDDPLIDETLLWEMHAWSELGSKVIGREE